MEATAPVFTSLPVLIPVYLFHLKPQAWSTGKTPSLRRIIWKLPKAMSCPVGVGGPRERNAGMLSLRGVAPDCPQTPPNGSSVRNWAQLSEVWCVSAPPEKSVSGALLPRTLALSTIQINFISCNLVIIVCSFQECFCHCCWFFQISTWIVMPSMNKDSFISSFSILYHLFPFLIAL